MQHNIRIDGTPATAADIRQARQWSSRKPTGRIAQYKSREFVESGTEDDPTQEESGLSTPSRQESPSPPRNRRRKRSRDESSASPSSRHSTSPRRNRPWRPAKSSPAPSRPATLPRSAPTTSQEGRKVRFRQEQEAMTSGKSDATKAETPQPSTATTSTTARRKSLIQQPPPVKTDEQLKQETAVKELVVSTPKLDALVKVA